MKTSKRLIMSATDQATLEGIARNGNTPQKLALRARIAVMSAEGLTTSQIMQELGTSTPTITRWRARYEVAGVSGLLRDRTRPGRKKRINETKVREIVERTLNEKPQEATHWSTRMLRTLALLQYGASGNSMG